jgi:hypothetical protein
MTKDELVRCAAISSGEDEPFGVHVTTPDTEYELAWLAFSGKVRHTTVHAVALDGDGDDGVG